MERLATRRFNTKNPTLIGTGWGEAYKRLILSLWLTNTSPRVTGITTITVPQTRLHRKLAKDGVI